MKIAKPSFEPAPGVLVRGGRVLRWVGWLAIAGGMVFSAVRVVTLLARQAFDQVAGAGQPAVLGLLGGAALIGIGNLLIDPPRLGGGGRRHGRRTPAHPLVQIGGVIMVLGLAYAGYGATTILLDGTVSGFAPLAAAPGLAIAALGGVVVVLGAVMGRKR